MADGNRARYEDPGVAAYYGTLDALQPTEVAVFARHLGPGMAILDIGVGGGRTAPQLSARAGRYVGIDYSAAMVEVCRARLPHLSFVECDVRDLSPFAAASFDAAVFSFNGIDYLGSDDDRRDAFREVARVLRPGGVFVFSSHNARNLAVWPELWNARLRDAPARLREAAAMSAGVLRAMWRSDARARGEGYVWDPVHGGLRTYVSTPAAIAPQLAAAGFRLAEVVAAPTARPRLPALVRWYYYVATTGSVPR